MFASLKYKFLFGFFGSIISFATFSQSNQKHCGTDEMHQDLFKNHPEYNVGIQRAYERLKAETKAYV